MTSIPDPQFPTPGPRPRRSSIAQSATAAQPSEPPKQETPSAPARRVAQRPAPAVQPSAQSERDSHRKGGTRDILLSIPDDAKDRMVRTIAFTMPYTGIRHQQAFIRRAIDDLCAALETQYNNGDPFPEIVQ